MADIITNRGKYLILARFLTGATTDLRGCIVTGTATGVDDPDLNTVADLDAVSGVSIHTERVALTGEAVTEDDTDNRGELDTANATFAAAAGVTARAFAVYDEGGGADATRELIGVWTTGFPQPLDGGLVINVADLIRAT